MPLIRMERQGWDLSALVGTGGFATVYEARGEDGRIGAVKLIPKSFGASRDVLFADVDATRGQPGIVPIIDVGETETHWALVMPLASRVLRDELGSGGLDYGVCKPVFLGVLTALTGLDGKVVHRDLKPDNVFLIDDDWCVGDFGIARYAQATTSPDTQKFSMTPGYASPEQWRLERATSKTDVYAFGVMAFEVLCGHRPFAGPSVDDLREQHLHVAAPQLDGVEPALAAMVVDCLMKAPEARPTASRLLARLQSISLDLPSRSAGKLQQVNLRITSERAVTAAEFEKGRSESERRRDLYESAELAFGDIVSGLRDRILAQAPATAVRQRGQMTLGNATLGVDPPVHVTAASWGPYVPPIDVIAASSVEIAIPDNRYGYCGRAASLWFCDAQSPGDYRWFEVAFMTSALSSRRTKCDPIALSPGPEAGLALSNVTGGWQLAWPFTPIDQGEGEDFYERWMGWFADGASVQLHRPSKMPEIDHQILRASYRRN